MTDLATYNNYYIFSIFILSIQIRFDTKLFFVLHVAIVSQTIFFFIFMLKHTCSAVTASETVVHGPAVTASETVVHGPEVTASETVVHGPAVTASETVVLTASETVVHSSDLHGSPVTLICMVPLV